MNYISIHDTHRLPYKNATITAKTVQSGDTTPLEFINALNDEVIGFEVYTNADGYLCGSNGTLFTKGIFVKEDAYITATLRSGVSTSWIVRSDTDVLIGDGKLLGKVVPPEEQSPEETYVLYNGEWHLWLHSANTDKNSVLRFPDLADTPNLNEWNETEQVKNITASNNAVSIDVYAKTLLLQWKDGAAAPNVNSPVYVTLSAERIGRRYRFAQHCMVMNQTPYRVTLVDAESGMTIGSVDPEGGTLNIGLFFWQSDTIGNWVVDEDLVSFNTRDVANGDYYKITGAPVNGFYEVIVNDRTPSALVIRAEDIQMSNVPFPGEIPVKLVGESGKLTMTKRVTVWFQNMSTGTSAATLPAKICYGSSAVLAIIQPFTVAELLVPALDTNHPAFTDSYGPILLDASERATTNVITRTISSAGAFVVPHKCDAVGLTVTGVGDNDIRFHSSTAQVVRFDVTNNTGSPVWFNLQREEDSTTQLQAVCPANDTCHFVVRNEYGRLYAVSETKSYPTGVVSEHVSTYTHDVNVSYDIKGLATQLVINCGALNKETGVAIGQHSGCRTRVYLDVSKVITDGTQHHLEVDLKSFMTDANQDHEGVVIHLGPASAGYDHSQEITRTEPMSAEGEDRYYFDPAIISLDAYKNGTDTNYNNKHYR